MADRHIHGGDIYRNPGVTDFSVNTNPLGIPENVLTALQEHMPELVRYPDVKCEELCKAISNFEQVEMDEILCGNGAAELFFAAVLAVRPKKALVMAPTFAEYEGALQVADTEVIHYYLHPEYGFAIQNDLLDLLTPDLDMMFLCNPNNPTGQTTDREFLLKVLQRCKENEIMLVLDECFLDFLENPEVFEMKGYMREYPNLLIVKAFTKIFCMPGVRLGYAISGQTKLLEKMSLMLQPWNVSGPAQIAGVAALADPEEYILSTRRYIAKEREIMKEMLKKSGYNVYDSKANYIFFQADPGLAEQALEAGFLIRDCGNYEGLESGYYRIAVRTEEENERLITWLTK